MTWLLAWADQNDASVSNLKVQKLLYYAQGHYLGIHGRPLFNDAIEAWAHGPVVRSVYHELKRYGNGSIDVDQVVGDDFDWDDFKDVEEHLMRVWNTYGEYEAWALRNRTHREAPWKTTFDEGERGLVISHQKMQDYFTPR
jgi:uncharacterized phage-associated protein